MVDALKNFMSTMTDAITRQVSEPVRGAIEVANSARPPSLRLPTGSQRRAFSPTGADTVSPSHGARDGSVSIRLKRLALYGVRRMACSHETHRLPHTGATAKPPPMTVPPKPQNASKYCEFHKQSGHTTTECRELEKAFHKLADKEQEPGQPQPRDKECSTEVVATIVRHYVEGITRSAWKAQLRSAQQALTAEQGPRVTAPTMVFGGKEAPQCASLHNDPLVVEMKLVHPGCDIIAPYLGLWWAGGESHGMIQLPVHFGSKLWSKNLEVDFLVIDAPTAYNMILGCPSRGGLHIGLSTVLVTLLLRSPGLSIQGVSGFIPCVLTLGGRRHKPHLLRVTTVIGSPLMLIPYSGGRLRNSYPLKTLRPASPGLFINTRGTSSSWRCNPFFLASWASRSALSVCQHCWYRVTSPFNLRHSVVALIPLANTSAMAISSSVTLGGSEAPGVTKSQDLTKSWTSESLAAGSALMKLVDGHWLIGWNRRQLGKQPLRSGSPHWQWGEGRGLIRITSVRCRFQTGRLMAGFFPRGMREGACKKMTQSVESRDYEKGEQTRPYIVPFWPVTRCCLSFSCRCSASAVTCSGVASSVSKIVNLALA
ncbi:LOW QUALITY PROTEIN: hypothetical protein Cgig2_027202 [Carnegiea gigantea]|uniref:Uncharacterized protein n=1 Tax=Carnegiea gigantea TaxID=171969 RepID=A0A9Q1KU95_9CARY|nr:LOW QUALITY PROTEIN: hypothetical protein Cgig2_027202 [Carnegiea gigantea]